MSIANVGSKWSSGVLKFFSKTTNDDILIIDNDGDVELGTGQHVKGERFTVNLYNFAAATVGQPFFIAPATCKIVSAYERHITVCDAADTLTIEKIETGEAPGAGDVTLSAAFTLNSTANTPVTKSAITTAAGTLAAGDALCTKFASGDGTNYAGANFIVTMEWL